MSEFLNKEQFGNPYMVESFGGHANFLDVRPEHLVSDVPVLVAGGWTVGSKALKQVASEIYSHGRRTILVDHARSGNSHEDGKYSQEVLHKANTLLAVLDEAGVDKVDVIAHSEGALNAVQAAIQHPEKFRSLVLVAPAGMIGSDTFLGLAGRFVPKVARNMTRDIVENPKVVTTAFNSGSPYVLKNISKSAREVISIADTQIDDDLRGLKRAGIHIGLIQSQADPLFPAKRIKEHVSLDEDDEVGNVDSYASVAWEKAGHDDLMIHPERTARAAIQMIEQFERWQPTYSRTPERTLQ